jgi:hypothetical protein
VVDKRNPRKTKRIQKKMLFEDEQIALSSYSQRPLEQGPWKQEVEDERRENLQAIFYIQLQA